MGLITETIQSYLPAKRKKTPSGWISFNAPCCDDNRMRGGFITYADDGLTYHCFNCQFKASWQPGRLLSKKMRQFMRHLHMPDDTINQLSLEAMRQNEGQVREFKTVIPSFGERVLPPESKSLQAWAEWAHLGGNTSEGVINAVSYLMDRKLKWDEYPYYYSPEPGFSRRIIVPFMYKGQIVGYTARAMTNAKPKYLSEQQPGYVFNLDNQTPDREFVIVSEGPFDALSVDGCAILSAEVSDSQNWLLRQLNKEIVLVPDRDEDGAKTVERAIELGWSVSMPEWPAGVKDVNDALVKLGRLTTLYLIVNARESNELKIRLRAKKWFKKHDTETD